MLSSCRSQTLRSFILPSFFFIESSSPLHDLLHTSSFSFSRTTSEVRLFFLSSSHSLSVYPALYLRRLTRSRPSPFLSSNRFLPPSLVAVPPPCFLFPHLLFFSSFLPLPSFKLSDPTVHRGGLYPPLLLTLSEETFLSQHHGNIFQNHTRAGTFKARGFSGEGAMTYRRRT